MSLRNQQIGLVKHSVLRKHGGLRKRRGFTLVELLVVISIIGMLAALLLPAVQNAREAGRRAVCVNNQRQLGLAIINYEGSKGAFPGYRNVQAVHNDGSGNLSARPVGWIFELLPFMDRNDIYSLYGSAGQDIAENPDTNTPYKLDIPDLGLAIAKCPSDALLGTKAGLIPSSKAQASYVCNAGMWDMPQQSAGSGRPRDPQPNGVFFDRFPYVTGSNDAIPVAAVEAGLQLVNMTTSYLTAGDGATTTLMLSENADCGNWFDPTEQYNGFNWYPEMTSGVASPPDNVEQGRINGLTGLRQNFPENQQPYFARPSSFHPGGVVVVFCDGHTTFIADTIDYAVYGQLMSSRGKYSGYPGTAPGSAPNVYKTPLDEGAY